VAKFNVYYELADFVADNSTIFGMKGKYFVLTNQNSIEHIPSIHYELARHSNRVWQEREGMGVKCIKNRNADLQPLSVDEKEFMWIKLSSKAIN
jgi:hypothetical protein